MARNTLTILPAQQHARIVLPIVLVFAVRAKELDRESAHGPRRGAVIVKAGFGLECFDCVFLVLAENGFADVGLEKEPLVTVHGFGDDFLVDD